MRMILALGALLFATQAQAAPVTFDTPAILRAPACKIGWVFGAPVVAPPCLSPLTVDITLPAGDPTSLWGTLAYYPTGFDSHAAVGLSQDRRVTLGGPEHFALPPDLVAGDYVFGLALSSVEYNALIIYSFALEWPSLGQSPVLPGNTSPDGGPGIGGAQGPVTSTPDPATLLLIGVSAVAVGWWKRRGR